MPADFPPKIGELAEVDKQSFINLIENGDFESWSAGTSSAPDGWLAATSPTIARENTITKIGSYSTKLTATATGSRIYFDVSDYTRYTSKVVTLGCWVYAVSADKAVICIHDGSPTISSYHPGGSSWVWMTVTKTVSGTPSSLQAQLYPDLAGGSAYAYFDGAILVEGSVCPAFSPKPLIDKGDAFSDFLDGEGTQSFTNLLENGDFESWSAGASAAPDGWGFDADGSGAIAEIADTKIATYIARVTKSTVGNSDLHFSADNYQRYQGRTVTYGVWVKSANTYADAIELNIHDGVGYTRSYYQNSGDWEWITVTKTVNAAANRVRCHNMVRVDSTSTADFVGAILVEGSVCPAFSPKPLIDDGRTIQIDSTTNKLTLGNLLVCTPSSDTAITAAGGIAVTNAIMRVVGDGAAIDITADPQIAAGSDGQLLIVQGTSDANTVQLDDGTGLILEGAVAFVLGANDMIMFAYDSGELAWIEINRSNN